MAMLREALSVDLSGYVPVEPQGPKFAPPIDNDLQPRLNPFLRCPIPPVSVSPDSLRSFYIGGKVPQMRLLPAPNASSPQNGSTVINNTTVTNSSTSSSSSNAKLAAQQASITTAVLNPGDVFTGSLLLAKSFQLLQVSANSPCRVELYGTALAQTLDAGRALDEAPGAGIAQNIISDVALDTVPYQLPYQNRIAANNDSPQTSLIYVTITNLDVTSDTITVTIRYVPLES